MKKITLAHINIKEIYAFLFAINEPLPHFLETKIIIYDNKISVTHWLPKSSVKKEVIIPLQKMVILLFSINIEKELYWLLSMQNTLAEI